MNEAKFRAALEALMLLGEIAKALHDKPDGEPLTDADRDLLRARSVSALERLREAHGDNGSSIQ